MSINNDSQKAPILRFKGFTDDWEERELIEVSKITMGQSPDGANYTQNPSDHILVQGNADMKNGKVTPRIWTTQVTKIANENDIILGVRAPVGVVGTTDYDVVIGRGVAGIKGNTFIYYDLVHKYYNNYWTKYSTGSTFDSINADDVKNASIHLPNLSEQTKIGNFIKLIDNTITFNQRKLDQLKQLKEALLQQMFPGKGETVPKLRFAGFEGDWEERKYIDVCKITMGQSPNGANYTQNPRDHILVQGNADMKNGEVVPRIWTTQVTKVANVNDIILGVRAPVGVVGITNYDVVIGRGVAGIKGSIFIYYDLVQKLKNNYWSKYSTGSTFDSINSDDIKNANIHLPCLSEQNHIGSFFKTLDNPITLQQRKLDQLKNMKQVLLQNMFI